MHHFPALLPLPSCGERSLLIFLLFSQEKVCSPSEPRAQSHPNLFALPVSQPSCCCSPDPFYTKEQLCFVSTH